MFFLTAYKQSVLIFLYIMIKQAFFDTCKVMYIVIVQCTVYVDVDVLYLLNSFSDVCFGPFLWSVSKFYLVHI